MIFDHIELGATLYVPATRPDLVAIANSDQLQQVRSVIFCTEDAIRADELSTALSNLEAALPQLRSVPKRRYVRVRNPDVLHWLLGRPGVENLNGFVLPKVSRQNLATYLSMVPERAPFRLMPTLETPEVFDAAEMRALCKMLLQDHIRPRILAVRIGGNDLLNLLNLRRSCRSTIYDTALGSVIGTLTGIFHPYGVPLTAPVFEGLEHVDVLTEEVARDIQHGLFAKTAIHPAQVQIIESMYAVTREDQQMAERILQTDAPAVFRMEDRMCEPATHGRWASQVQTRMRIFGVADPGPTRLRNSGFEPAPARRVVGA